MSGVRKSERGESRLEAQHVAYKLRKLIVKELLSDFGTKNNTMPEWLIEEERKRVLDLCQGINNLYKDLFGKEITWKISRLRYLTAQSSTA